MELMPGPPFLANFGAADGEVLPVGRWTCPFCVEEADGGDPSTWAVVATHAQLRTMQEDNPIEIEVTGTHTINWARTIITESGDAASCAKRITNNTGESGFVDYTFTSNLVTVGRTCLGLADGTGELGETVGAVPESPDSSSLAITDNQTGSALCGSTGCVAGDYGAYNNDTTGTIEVEHVSTSYVEKFCRDTLSTYRYTFTGQVTVGGQAGPTGPPMAARVLLYTGTFDEARWGITLPLDPEFTLSAETTVGTVRGITIKAKYITFSVDHADSTITGTSGQCPLPSYSSDVTTGTTTGTISCTVSG